MLEIHMCDMFGANILIKFLSKYAHVCSIRVYDSVIALFVDALCRRKLISIEKHESK